MLKDVAVEDNCIASSANNRNEDFDEREKEGKRRKKTIRKLKIKPESRKQRQRNKKVKNTITSSLTKILNKYKDKWTTIGQQIKKSKEKQ